MGSCDLPTIQLPTYGQVTEKDMQLRLEEMEEREAWAQQVFYENTAFFGKDITQEG